MNKSLLVACSLLIASTIHAQRMASANALVNEALKTAKAQNKNVLLIFHASWCSWCKKMDKSLNDPACKTAFDNNYVTTHITVFESGEKKQFEHPGGEELMKKYQANEAGLPFWVILDANGNLLFDSFLKGDDGKKGNVGCPASEKEVAFFLDIIRATAELKDGQLEAIRTVFRNNEQH